MSSPQLRTTLRLLTACFVILSAAHAQRTINVPADQPSIQQAIQSASNGDTVRIAPGTYNGPFDFSGKNIIVTGSAAGVILNGNGHGPVVTFKANESRSAILSNVTVRGGSVSSANIVSTAYDAGGIYINHASPTIQNVTVTANYGCGIGVQYGAPLVTGSMVAATTPVTNGNCVPANKPTEADGGIVVYGDPANSLATEITSSTITGNAVGIVAVDAGHVVIRNNVITGNTPGRQGGGVSILRDTSATVSDNLIADNTIDAAYPQQAYAATGAGLNIDLFDGSQHNTPTIVANNTIANNHLIPEPGANLKGSQVLALNHDDNVTFTNNLIIAGTNAGDSAVDCLADVPSTHPPVFDHNDVFSTGGGALYSSQCTNQTGSNGNISAAPLFTGAATYPYQLQAGSPAIDTGNNSVLSERASLLHTDLAGQPRLQNATGTRAAIIDMGAYEAPGIPATLPPPPPIQQTSFTLRLDPVALTLRTQHHDSLTVTVNGSAQNPIALSCSNLPAHATCTFDQPAITLDNSGTAHTTLTVDTSDVLGYQSSNTTPTHLLTAALFAPLLFLFRRSRKTLLSLLAIILAIAPLNGCSGKLPASTAPGAYTINVTGTDTASGQSAHAPLALTVTP